MMILNHTSLAGSDYDRIPEGNELNDVVIMIHACMQSAI